MNAPEARQPLADAFDEDQVCVLGGDVEVTHAGGMTINDWAWHVLQSDLPFGGIGESGMGSYHGEEGFRTLSHGKSIFQERRWFPIGLFHPPYGNLVQRLSMRLYLGRQAGH